MGLPDAARHFQQAGITALVYDPRSTGQSDGVPRNNIDPAKQTEDYSDALTFLSGLPTVDRNQMGIWGMSLAGAISLSAASLDKRAKLVIAVCPLIEYRYTAATLPKVLAKCMQDRESQVQGNAPFYLPMVTETGENPAGFGVGIQDEHYAKLADASQGLAPMYANRTTIQSYYRMMMWQPLALWQHLDSTPVMFVVPELDRLCSPDIQLHCFRTLPGPKSSHIVIGKGHMNVLEGEHFAALMRLQVDFVYGALRGDIT